MNCLQQIVESRAVGIGQTDEPARRVHPRRAGKITVGALLTKMLLSLRPGFLAQPTGMDRCREVNGSDPLVTCFAEHRANDGTQPRRAEDSRQPATFRQTPGRFPALAAVTLLDLNFVILSPQNKTNQAVNSQHKSKPRSTRNKKSDAQW